MAQLVKNRLQCGRPGFDPWVGKIPWRRERLPTAVFWPGEFHELYSPWGHKELDMTEQLSLSLHFHIIGIVWSLAYFTSHHILAIFPYHYIKFFLLLSYTYRVSSNLFVQSTIDEHWSCFHYFGVWTLLQWITYIISCMDKCYFRKKKILNVELWNQRPCTLIILTVIPNFFL